MPNSVGTLVDAKEHRFLGSLVMVELERARTSETSTASATRHRGCEEEGGKLVSSESGAGGISTVLLLLPSRVLGTGESNDGNDADLRLDEHTDGDDEWISGSNSMHSWRGGIGMSGSKLNVC